MCFTIQFERTCAAIDPTIPSGICCEALSAALYKIEVEASERWGTSLCRVAHERIKLSACAIGLGYLLR